MAGHFRGVQFSRMVNLYHFCGFEILRTHVLMPIMYHTIAYFVGLIFVVRQVFMKSVKIGSLENSPLYGNT